MSCIDKRKHRNHAIQVGTVSKVVRTGNAITISNAGVIKISSITLTIYTIRMR